MSVLRLVLLGLMSLATPAQAAAVPPILMAGSNADLGSYATTDAPNGLQRCGMLTPFDSPCVPYLPTNSVCSTIQFVGTVTTSIVPTTQLNVSAVTSGTLSNGLVMPAGIFTAGTIISSQISGTPGGVGVYSLSQPFNPPPSFTLTVRGDGQNQVPSRDGKCWALSAPATNLTLSGLTIGGDLFSGVFGSSTAIISNNKGQNNIVGQMTNSLPANTNALPVATIGAAKLFTNGNQAFGVYGLSECRQSAGGVCPAAEFTASNYTTNNPDTSLPPNTAIGTATTVPTGVNITCGAFAGETKDCSLGFYITNETGNAANPIFNTGGYIGLYRSTGLFIDSMPSGTQTGLTVKGNGNGVIEQLTDTVAGSPSVAAIALNDSGGVTFSLRTNGEMFFTQTQTTVGAAGAASALPANPLGYLKMQTAAGEVVVPYYNH